MSSSTRHRLPMPGWAGPTLLLVLLAGLLGMHALDTHGVAADHEMVSGAGMDAGHPMAAAPGTREAPAFVPSNGLGDHGSMVGLCVGLVAGAALLLFLARDGVHAGGAERLLLRAPVRLTRGRDRDPPSLVHLSVHRC